MREEIHQLTLGSSLSLHSINRIRKHLRDGGVCIVPSDTGYALTGLPFQKDVIQTISTVLHHDSDPIPLSFGSMSMVEKYAELTKDDYLIMDTEFPGPITLVCGLKKAISETRKKAISELLHTSGTIGIRIPDSPVERQISTELDTPITTCAIRDDSGNMIRNFDDAVTIVGDRMGEIIDNFHLIGITANRILYDEQSTVLTLQKSIASPMKFMIFRYGYVDPKDIQHILNLPSSKDLDDFT